MIVQIFSPPSDLLPFVSGYLHGQSTFAATQLLPNIPRGVPALMIVINEHGSNHIEVMQPKHMGPLANGIFLFGQATQCWWVKVSTGQAYIAVLKPIALQWLLGTSAAEATDLVVEVTKSLPEGQFLAEQLMAEKSQFGQLAVLDTFLRRIFRNVIPRPTEMDGAVQRILQTYGQVRIGELSAQQRVSERTLTRRFSEQVGLSPKQYAQIIRFRAVMHSLIMAPNVPWLDVVHRFGYYDQSHFIKDFQHFTGQAPTHYLAGDQQFDSQFIRVLLKS